MVKKIFVIIKKIIMSALFIYAYNVIATPLNTIVPINLITILIVCVLGIPGLLGLIIFSLVVF